MNHALPCYRASGLHAVQYNFSRSAVQRVGAMRSAVHGVAWRPCFVILKLAFLADKQYTYAHALAWVVRTKNSRDPTEFFRTLWGLQNPNLRGPMRT